MSLRFLKMCRRLALLTLSAALVAGFAGCSKSTPAIKQGAAPQAQRKAARLRFRSPTPKPKHWNAKLNLPAN